MKRRLLCVIAACMMMAVPVMGEEVEEMTEVADVLQGEGEKFSIKVKSAEILESYESYGDIIEPQAGDVFLLVNFEVRNISDEDDYFNRFYITSYADDFDVDQMDEFPSDAKVAVGDVVAGKGLRGCLIFEVPDDWEVFEVYYDESFGDTEKIRLSFTCDSTIIG